MNTNAAIGGIDCPLSLYPTSPQTALGYMKLPEIIRLSNLLKQVVALAYIRTVNCTISKGIEAGAYYEDSVSFLTKIEDGLKREYQILKAGGPSVNRDYSTIDPNAYGVPLAYLDSLRGDVLNIIDLFLHGTEGYCPRSSVERVTAANYVGVRYAPTSNFFSQFIRWYQYAIVPDALPYDNVVEICIPTIRREGYTLQFSFCASGVCDLSKMDAKFAACSNPFTLPMFLACISFTVKSCTSDSYLYLMQNLSLSCLPARGYSHLDAIQLLRQLFSSGGSSFQQIVKLMHRQRLLRNQGEQDANLISLFHVIEWIARRQPLKIGPKTNTVLQAILTSTTTTIRDTIEKFFASQQVVEGDVTKALEALEGEDEPEVEPIPPKEDEDPPSEEEDETDPPDEDEPDEGEDEEDETPVALIRVPKGSYLLSIRDPARTSLDEYLYLVEVSNLITRVLRNPPDTMKESHKEILATIQREWLYLMDVESIDSFVNNILKIVVKDH
jgi:hypothetical protein